MQVHEASALNRIAKAAAPPASRLVGGRLFGEGIRLLEIYLEILQGRGSGTGWDLRGETVAARRFLRDVGSPVIFDVGANLGQWASMMQAELDGRDARFYQFEPQSACLPVLRARQDASRVVIPCAVGKARGEATIYADIPGSGVASLNRRQDSYFGDMSAHQETVPLTTIDHEVAEQGVNRIDLLKLDVEGSELAALQGAEATLRAGRISTIAFEFGSGNVYSRTFFRDFWDLLVPLGYQLWRIRPGGRTTPVPAYTEELEHFRGVSNYIASRTAP
jgi:FkbM family methyltransferase